MNVKDIQIGEYYAIVAHPAISRESQIRQGQVIAALEMSHWRVHFRNPVARGSYCFVPDKAHGSREHDLEVDCFYSTWSEYKAKQDGKQQQQERLARELESMRESITRLLEIAKEKGIGGEMEADAWTRYKDEEEAPIARLTLSHDTLLAIIEGLERLETHAADVQVVQTLLGEHL